MWFEKSLNEFTKVDALKVHRFKLFLRPINKKKLLNEPTASLFIMNYFSNSFNVSVIIRTQSSNCSSFITKGGAKRMMLPCVGFASKPLSRKRKQIFHAVSLSSLSLIKMALSNPFPRTKVQILEF